MAFDSPILIKWNEEMQRIQNEQQVITTGAIITLSQIPSEYQKVQIENMTEIKENKAIAATSQFKVNYRNGIITFHEDKIGQQITIQQYYGRGYILYSSDRIYDSSTGQDINTVKTLQDYIDSIRALGYKGDYSNIETYLPNSIIYYPLEKAIYRCIKLSVGNLPTNLEYWQIMVSVKTEAEYAVIQGDYAKLEGDYANDKGDYANAQGALANTATANANATSNAIKVYEVYDNTQPYIPLNKVSFNRNSYVNIVACTGVSPSLDTDNSNWILMAKHGSDGFSSMLESSFTATTDNTTHIPHNLIYDPTHDKLQVNEDYSGGELKIGRNYSENVDNLSIDLLGWSINIGEIINFTLYKNLNEDTLQSEIAQAIINKTNLDVSNTTANSTKDALDLSISNGQLGVISNLLTTDKSSHVNAINEVFNKTGVLTTLNTQNKDNLVGAINETVSSLADKAQQSDLGNKANLPTTDKTSFENSIKELYLLLITKLSQTQINLLIGFADINKNLSQIDETMLTSGLLAMIAGTAGVNVTPSALSVLTGMLADKAITPIKLSFTPVVGIPSKNLFNKDTVALGYLLNYTTGTIDANANYSVSDWIPVSSSTAYIKNQNRPIAFYTSAKAYISGLPTATTFTTPANCVYVRIGELTANIGIDQLELGSVSTSYESYYTKINPLNIKEKTIEQVMLNFLSITGTASKNLFDKSAAIKDFYVRYDTGNIEALAGYYASYWIPVLPSTGYVRVQNTHVAFYTSAKAYISGLPTATTFTTPANCYYVRITVSYGNFDVEQLELGSISTSYESYGNKIDNSSFPKELQNINNYTDFGFTLPDDIYLITGENFSIYYNNIIKYSQKFRNGNYYITHILQNSTPTATVKGEGYPYKWTITPTVAETFTMEFAIIETYTGLKMASKTVTFHVADSSLAVNHGRTANIISIGDSFFENGLIAEALNTFVTTKGGINNINLLGTRVTTTTGVKTDAIPGWSYDNYINYATVGGIVNPFWNPSTSLFDFTYYMTQYYPTYTPGGQAGEHIDVFVSLCGINDLSTPRTNIANETYIQTIIDSIHAFDPTIKVLLGTVTPQPLDDKWSTNYQNDGRHYEKFKYKQELFNEMILTLANISTNIYLLPVAAHFDTRSAIKTQLYYPDKFDPTYSETQTRDIHPTEIGGKYMADSVYQFLYSMVLR